jgi:diguanylate cyclase (GGDEF)-like protein
MMDIDDFKQINDEYGHLTGDKVLSQIGQLVKSEIRSNDIIGRYGGDEFIIGLTDASPQTAQAIANRISQAIAAYKIPLSNSKTLSFTVSIGGTTLNDEPTLDQFINNADKKLYEAKRNGKNIVKF